MEFDKLISVSGYGSLYKIVSRTNFGLIAESLEDGKRMPVYQSYNVSTLNDISIYTGDGETPLREVLLKLHEKEGGKETAITKQKDPEIKKYFEEILPDYDKERVYTSDIKKLLKWYNQLVKTNNLDPEDLKKTPESEESKEETTSVNEAKSEDSTEKKAPAKKEKSDAAKKKTSTAKTNKSAPKVTNAPAKKVQTVRKSGGS